MPRSRKHKVIIYQIVRWHEKRKTEKTITERVLALTERQNNKAQQHHNCFIIFLASCCFNGWCGDGEGKHRRFQSQGRIKMQKPFSFIIAFLSSKHPRLGVSTFADLVINFICAVFSRSKSCQVTLSLSSCSALVRLGSAGRRAVRRRFSCLFFQWFNLLIYYHAWVASSGAGDDKTGSGREKMTLSTNNCFLARGNGFFSRAILDVINFHFCHIAAAKTGEGKTIS